ncbi:protein pygopus-like [Lineus longissimus]|uniref:protein pygopus-like n=1 Tax=Lineus longissimus TaxID=88925 RepID=UPI002B4E6639
MSDNIREIGHTNLHQGGAKKTPAARPRGRPRGKKAQQETKQLSPSSEIVPHPLSNTGDNNTIVAQNPFDDCPPHPHNIAMHNKPHPGMQTPLPPPTGTGKVYPPNQPMIFNPSNPNAPPIYPCGVCHKEVHDNDQAILCESGCNFWFHRNCTGLTEAAYHLLTQEVYAEWVCDKCLAVKNIPLVKMKP